LEKKARRCPATAPNAACVEAVEIGLETIAMIYHHISNEYALLLIFWEKEGERRRATLPERTGQIDKTGWQEGRDVTTATRPQATWNDEAWGH
jgi:hypothetical protein